MDLEFHQLDLRYEKLRRRDPRRERQLIASLAEQGQTMPIIVLPADATGRYVVVDGYKRIRAHQRLRLDTVRVTIWELEESEALLLERLMRTAEREGPLEQGWLLVELRTRFGLALEEMSRRFDRSTSWVSRRLALVEELPTEVQEYVRAGAIVAHAAMKCLVPLARANRDDCVRLAAALAGGHASSRQVAELYTGWQAGGRTRELVLADPWLFLRVREEARREEAAAKSPAQLLLDDLGALGGLARRVSRRLGAGLARGLTSEERAEVHRCGAQARRDGDALFARLRKEIPDVRSEHPSRHPEAA